MENDGRPPIKEGVLAGLSDPKLAATLAAVHANPAHSWRIEEMANLAHMSRTSFANHFRDVAGMTLADYLIDWRMGLADSHPRKQQMPLGQDDGARRFRALQASDFILILLPTVNNAML